MIPILHFTPGSAGSVRARKIFALKNLSWRSCAIETDTGQEGAARLILSGAMGEPLLQVGASLWIGGLATIDALEELQPVPTLFPNGNRGMPLALAWWSDDFATQQNPGQILAHANLIGRQLADGRNFLQGAEAGLADVQAFGGLSAVADPDFAALPEALLAWLRRMNALGEGEREDISIEEALAELVNQSDPPPSGNPVRITQINSGESVKGVDLGNRPDELIIGVHNANQGTIRAHFPAIGYAVEPA